MYLSPQCSQEAWYGTIFRNSCYILLKYGLKRFDIILSSYMNLIDFVGVIISLSAVVSIILLVKQIKGEHEKSRREKTIDLLMTWSTNLEPETNFAVKIVEKFDRDQCSKLYRMEEFCVSKEICYEIKTVYSDSNYEKEKVICQHSNGADNCGQCKIGEQSDKVKLDKYYIKKLRFSIIQYLNLLETVCLSWKNGISDRDMIEEQFAYLHDPTNNKNCLQDFRNASGSEISYPSIESFCVQLEENRKSKIKSKDYIA